MRPIDADLVTVEPPTPQASDPGEPRAVNDGAGLVHRVKDLEHVHIISHLV